MKNSTKILKTVAAVAVALAIAAASFFAGYFTRKLKQGDSLSSYEWVLKIIKHNYYGEFDGEAAGELSLKALASKLDAYSEYYTAEEYAQLIKDNAGAKSGIGVTLNFIENKGAYIVTVMGNSPAYRAGITAGDLIASGTVDGKTAEFNTYDDFTGFMDARKTGEKFTLSTADNSFELAREEYTASYASMFTRNMEWGFSFTENGKIEPFAKANLSMSYLPEDTAYIRLSQFYGTAGEEFGRLIKNFNANRCASLILDLRNNGGGYVPVMQDIAGCFVSSATDKSCVAMTAKYKNGREERYDCVKRSGDELVPQGTKIYVLANSGTASASEALIGVLVSYGLLEYENIFLSDFSQEYLNYVGAGAKTKQSYGKGIMQSTFVNFFTGEALKLTTAQIYWPNGNCIHGVGLTPENGCRLSPAEWTATKGDNELQYVIKQIN